MGKKRQREADQAASPSPAPASSPAQPTSPVPTSTLFPHATQTLFPNFTIGATATATASAPHMAMQDSALQQAALALPPQGNHPMHSMLHLHAPQRPPPFPQHQHHGYIVLHTHGLPQMPPMPMLAQNASSDGFQRQARPPQQPYPAHLAHQMHQNQQSTPSQAACQGGLHASADGSGGGGGGGDGGGGGGGGGNPRHVRFQDEPDTPADSTAAQGHAQKSRKKQEKLARQIQSESSRLAAKQAQQQGAGCDGGKDHASQLSDAGMPPTSTAHAPAISTAISHEYATEGLCHRPVSLIRLRSNLKWDYASVLAIFQGRLESLLLASRSDPATLDFLNTASQALVAMYLPTDTAKAVKRAKETKLFWGQDLLIRMMLQTLHQSLPSWQSRPKLATSQLGSRRLGAKGGTAEKPDETDGSICIDISDEEETDVAPEDAGIHGSRKVGLAIQKLQLALSEGRPTVGGWDVKALEALKLALFKQLKMDERRFSALAAFLQYILPTPGTKPAASAITPDATSSVDLTSGPAAAATTAPTSEHTPSLATYTPPSQSELAAAVRQLSGEGCGILALARLESRLCERFSASSFAQLRAGQSLLAALSARPEWVEVLSGGSGGDGPCRAPLREVLHLVADVLQQHGSLATDPDPLTPANLSHASPDVRAAVAATLRRQYTIQHVTTLGHGSVTHLVQAAVAKFQSGELQLTPWLRHALVLTSTAQSTQQSAIAFSSAFGQRSDTSAGQDAARDNQGDDISMLDAPAAAESVTGSSVPRDSQQQVGTGPGFGSWQGQGQGSASAAAEGEGFGAVVGVLGDVGRSRAVAVLCSIPEMADLHSASCWDVVFAPELGPLEGFVRREGAACGIAAISLLPPTLGAPALSLPCGRLLKVRHGATAGDIIDAACKGTPPPRPPACCPCWPAPAA
ncbi:MAG: hypothetical protein WDW38_008735 [Sanguina aurantia]